MSERDNDGEGRDTTDRAMETNTAKAKCAKDGIPPPPPKPLRETMRRRGTEESSTDRWPPPPPATPQWPRNEEAKQTGKTKEMQMRMEHTTRNAENTAETASVPHTIEETEQALVAETRASDPAPPPKKGHTPKGEGSKEKGQKPTTKG